MRILVASLLLASLLTAVPSASAAACDAELRIEADCWVDYVQPRVGYTIDMVEEETGEDLSGPQVFFDWAVDRVQDAVRPIFDLVPDYIPCVSPGGPHCW